MTINISVNKILNEIDKLPISDRLDLIEKVIHKSKLQQRTKQYLDRNELYGLGKGIWNGLDAQDYVNELTAERSGSGK